MDRKNETAQMLVTVRLSYDTLRARADALKEIRQTLGCQIYSSGVDGSFSVESGRVRLYAPKKLPNVQGMRRPEGTSALKEGLGGYFGERDERLGRVF